MPLVLSIPPDIFSFTSLLKREDILRMGYVWGCKKLIKMKRVAKKKESSHKLGLWEICKEKIIKNRKKYKNIKNVNIFQILKKILIALIKIF